MEGVLAQLDVVEVLTEVGAARDAFCAALGDEPDTDAALIGDVLRVHGRVAEVLAARGALVASAVVLRSLHGWSSGRIEFHELVGGLRTHARATERFAAFGDARVDLRTLLELVERVAPGDEPSPALRGQVQLLDENLRAWFRACLFGAGASPIASGAPTASDPRAAHRVVARHRAREIDANVRELLAGAPHHVLTGFASSCWRRGWIVLPVAGEQLGDDPQELRRIEQLVRSGDVRTMLHVDLAPPPRWDVRGPDVVVLDAHLRAFELPADGDGLALAAAPRRGWALLAPPDLGWTYLERDEHHVVAGPRDVVEAVLGTPAVEAMAAFRLHVEARGAHDEDPPAHLLDACSAYARLLRRGARI